MSPIIPLLLNSIRPADTAALRLLADLLERQPEPGEYLRLSNEIAEATASLEALAQRSRKAMERCKRLQAQSSPQVPAGF